MEKMRTFKQLQEEKSFQELNEFSKEVTEHYANTPIENSQSAVAENNRITIKALRDLMDMAIKTALVSYETANKSYQKCMENQKRKEESAGGTSYQHHQKLLKQRTEFLVMGYARSEIKKIAEDIANHPREKLVNFQRKYQLESSNLLKQLLQRSIVENIVDDETVEKIRKRSLIGSNAKSVNKYFGVLLEKRKNAEKGQI